MARVHPAFPVEQSWSSEHRVLHALTDLDDSWHIFHSVAWQGNRKGREADGEADIILLHRAFGLVVIEVKGGNVDVVDGVWHSQDQHGVQHRIKNPFDQAKDSKYALIRFLDGLGTLVRSTPVCHAVAFPDSYCPGRVGLYGPREIILDAVDLSHAITAVQRVIAHWRQSASLSREAEQVIVRLLAPTIQIRKTLGTVVGSVNQQLIQLTRTQIGLLSFLRGVRRCRIEGGAGTGKTVLAVEKARQLSEAGFNVLVTCFSALLAEELKRQFSSEKSVAVASFHELALTTARKTKLVTRDTFDEEWWESEAATVLAKAAGELSVQYDAIIVDEAQDFHETWLIALGLLCSDQANSPYYVFSDSNQQIFRRGCKLPDWPVYYLDVNCRNTVDIARKVSAVFGARCEARSIAGVEPVFSFAESDSDVVAQVQSWTLRLLDEEGLRPEQLVVLTDSQNVASDLRRRNIGEHSFASYGRAGIAVETIHRFKGLEADVVIAAFSTRSTLPMDDLRKLAYVAFSRARAVLLVVGPGALREQVGWSDSHVRRG